MYWFHSTELGMGCEQKAQASEASNSDLQSPTQSLLQVNPDFTSCALETAETNRQVQNKDLYLISPSSLTSISNIFMNY